MASLCKGGNERLGYLKANYYLINNLLEYYISKMYSMCIIKVLAYSTEIESSTIGLI